MDHFNATIKDGKLINTRRGLQVSKQKHNGLSFVNAYPHEHPIRSSSPARRCPKPSSSRSGVVEGESHPALGAPNPVNERAGNLEFSFVPYTAQGLKRRRKVEQRAQALPISRGNLSPRESPASAGEQTRTHSTSDREPNPRGSSTHIPANAPEVADPSLFQGNRKMLDRHFDLLARSLYPYEDILAYNPAREGDFHSVVIGDVAALHCVLMCGSIAEAVINSEADPKGFAYHISKICAILNQKLNQNHAADAVTLHCIAMLAWMGCYVGRLDHWHMHMRGLQRAVDVNGGMAGLPPWLLVEMFKADLKGATALALSPYLPFTRRYGSISTALPPEVRSRASHTVSALLVPLRISREVVDALCSLSLFASAIRVAGNSPGTITFDPHSFTDEWLAITHTLLTRPGPLRDAPSGLDEDPFWSTVYDGAGDDAGSQVQSHIAPHRLRPSVAIAPPPSGPGGVEPALRIAALLFLKDLLPDWPRNLGGYDVLLSLLRYHLREIMHQHQQHLDSGGTILPTPLQASPVSAYLIPPAPQQPRPQPSSEHDAVLIPLVDAIPATTSSAPSPPPSPLPHLLRPVLLFLAVVGDRSSSRGELEERYPRAIYRDVLRDVAGLNLDLGLDLVADGDEASVGVGTLADTEDLALLRLFFPPKESNLDGGFESLWGRKGGGPRMTGAC